MTNTKLLIKYLSLISVVFLTLGLTACGKDRTPKAELAAPENVSFLLNLTEDGETEFTLKWDKVKNATNYKVLVGGENISCRKTSLDITECVNAGRKTEIDVWAEDNEEEYKPSKPTTISVTPKKVSKNLKFTQVSGGYEVGSTSSIYDVELILPDTYLNKPVLEIADEGFRGDNFENPAVYNTVRLPNALKIIGNCSFYESNLKEISLPETVTKIGWAAFDGCKKLTKVDLGNVEYIDDTAFSSTNITELFIPKSVTYIGFGTFATEALKSVVFEEGSNLKDCGETVFFGSALTDFPENIPIIGTDMFNGCPNFPTEITIPQSVKKIKAFAFRLSVKTKKIHVPSTVTQIDGGAFNLEMLQLQETFWDASITIDENNPYYKLEDGVIYTKDGKQLVDYLEWIDGESFTVPSGVEDICDYAFYDAQSLKVLSLCDGLKTIGDYAFYNTLIKEFSLPDSVTTIGQYSFNVAAEKITLSNGITKIGINAFCSNTMLKYPLEIPDSVTCIEPLAFSSNINIILPKNLEKVCFGQPQAIPHQLFSFNMFNPAIPNVYYKGSAEDWAKLEEAGVFCETAFKLIYDLYAPIYFYSEEEPPKIIGGMQYDNNYWHYDENGNPVIWEIEK